MNLWTRTLTLVILALGVTGVSQPSAQAGGGSNNGGSPAASAIQWCRTSTSVLEIARLNAARKVQKGELDAAARILVDGLDRALQDPSRPAKEVSVVHLGVLRGIELAIALEELRKAGRVDVETQVTVLHFYASFLLTTVSSLDQEFILPYRLNPRDCKDCPALDQARFETRFLEYARQQIRWLTASFTKFDLARGVIPTTQSDAYLKLAEMLAGWVAADLRNPLNLWSAKYECVARLLDELQSNLAGYNTGNRAIYSDDVSAVMDAGQTLDRLIAPPKEAQSPGCGLWP